MDISVFVSLKLDSINKGRVCFALPSSYLPSFFLYFHEHIASAFCFSLLCPFIEDKFEFIEFLVHSKDIVGK
nr:MAG TPA: hypothetical protein [Caudoviricetes sp.]